MKPRDILNRLCHTYMWVCHQGTRAYTLVLCHSVLTSVKRGARQSPWVSVDMMQSMLESDRLYWRDEAVLMKMQLY